MVNFIIFAVFLPPVCAAACWLGRKYQYHHWNMHLPYDERVKLLHGLRK